jgi:hypothetical protein
MFTLMSITFNLIPALQLDGYWILSDWLGKPNLREDAFRSAWAWCKKPTSQPSGLVCYGLFAGLLGGAMFLLSIRVYVWVYWPIFAEARRSGLRSQVLTFFVFSPLIISIFLAAVKTIVRVVLRIQAQHVAGDVDQIVCWIDDRLSEKLDLAERKFVSKVIRRNSDTFEPAEILLQVHFVNDQMMDPVQKPSSQPDSRDQTSGRTYYFPQSMFRLLGADDVVPYAR